MATQLFTRQLVNSTRKLRPVDARLFRDPGTSDITSG
jgi:hypothetical protein